MYESDREIKGYPTNDICNRDRFAHLYFLYRVDELVYIGKSRNVFNRIANHEVDNDLVKLLQVPEELLDRLEIMLINRFVPKENLSLFRRTSVSFTPSEKIYLCSLGISTEPLLEMTDGTHMYTGE